MSDQVRIALDAMGGDHGPAVVVAGAELARQRHPENAFAFFGDTALIGPLLDARPELKKVSRLVHTDVAVRMEDKPSQALRYGRWKSSMWLAIDAVKKAEADMVLSAGNTGALMAMAKFNLKTLPGIERPAIDRMPCTFSITRTRGRTFSAISKADQKTWLRGSVRDRLPAVEKP